MSAHNLKAYLRNVQIEQLLKKLGVSNPKKLAEEVEHFTIKEGEKRDRIMRDYFGECAVNQIVDVAASLLRDSPKLPVNAKILDVGAGSGFFTVKIADKIRAEIPEISLYAMDITPTMLLSLIEKEAKITPFIGIAENIKGSIKEAKKFTNIPYKFDAVFSTLMLHHSLQPQKVFKSIKEVLKKRGKGVVLDLHKHAFKEFKTEMGDVHLGFTLEDIVKMAQKHFEKVEVKKLPQICCKSHGRSVQVFVANVRNC
jgi:ubiquinone/menaquinone biosynthesis C-methylase UbiE